MNVISGPATQAASAISTGLIDCDIHPLLRKPAEIKKYLPANWVEHLEVFGSNLRQPFHGADLWPKPSPHISRRDAYPPAGGPPGSDLASCASSISIRSMSGSAFCRSWPRPEPINATSP